VRRFRTAAYAWGVGAIVFVAAALPGQAADRNPADTLLDRARAAVASHDFGGTVRIGWRTASGMHWRQVTVRAADGGLSLDGGDVVEDDGRAWLRTDARWETLWTDTREPEAPSVGRKYGVKTGSGPTVAGRPTRSLTIARDGHVVERYAFDRTSGIVLRRVRYDDEGRVNGAMEFVRLGELRAGGGKSDTPRVGASAPQPLAEPPDDARRKVGDGFVLVDAHRVGDETQLRYSDGIFTASVFTSDGGLDWDALPAGGADVKLGHVEVRRYRTSGGTVLTWDSDGDTFTCVTDAPESDQREIVAALARSGDDAWDDAVRFVTGPFSWF